MAAFDDRDDDQSARDFLGADVPITRRDFLNGIPIAVGGAMAGGLLPEFIAATFAGEQAPQAIFGLVRARSLRPTRPTILWSWAEASAGSRLRISTA